MYLISPKLCMQVEKYCKNKFSKFHFHNCVEVDKFTAKSEDFLLVRFAISTF